MPTPVINTVQSGYWALLPLKNGHTSISVATTIKRLMLQFLKLRYYQYRMLSLYPMIYITQRERFSAAHKLSRTDWSVDRYQEVFGKSSNPNGHGHNYELYVTVKGEINPETGFLIDLRTMKDLISAHVIEKLD